METNVKYFLLAENVRREKWKKKEKAWRKIISFDALKHESHLDKQLSLYLTLDGPVSVTRDQPIDGVWQTVGVLLKIVRENKQM